MNASVCDNFPASWQPHSRRHIQNSPGNLQEEYRKMRAITPHSPAEIKTLSAVRRGDGESASYVCPDIPHRGISLLPARSPCMLPLYPSALLSGFAGKFYSERLSESCSPIRTVALPLVRHYFLDSRPLQNRIFFVSTATRRTHREA
jgi:hypothetical protein